MFKIVMICAIIGLAAASPVGPSADDVHADVISRKDDVRVDGYDTSLETTNHITRSESGDVHGNVHGDFGWISPEGEHVDVKYVADENGYQPQSSWLPTSPPIPEAIIRSIEWNAAHAVPEKH